MVGSHVVIVADGPPEPELAATIYHYPWVSTPPLASCLACRAWERNKQIVLCHWIWGNSPLNNSNLAVREGFS